MRVNSVPSSIKFISTRNESANRNRELLVHSRNLKCNLSHIQKSHHSFAHLVQKLSNDSQNIITSFHSIIDKTNLICDHISHSLHKSFFFKPRTRLVGNHIMLSRECTPIKASPKKTNDCKIHVLSANTSRILSSPTDKPSSAAWISSNRKLLINLRIRKEKYKSKKHNIEEKLIKWRNRPSNIIYSDLQSKILQRMTAHTNMLNSSSEIFEMRKISTANVGKAS
jgi:hypothetical protein